MRKLLFPIILLSCLSLAGQVSLTSSNSSQSPDARTITVLPSHMTGTFGQNFIGWAEVSDTFSTSVDSSNVVVSMTEYNQHPFSQIDGPNGAPSVTPMTVYLYIALPAEGPPAFFTSQYLAPGSSSFSIGSWPAGTTFEIIATGEIPSPMSQCFIYCGWQINLTLN